MRVMLIEDDPTIAVPLAESLARFGYEVERVESGLRGLELIGETDLVLLDLGLPDLDGVEVCRRIRAVSSVPIIVLSARREEFDRVLLLESGADDYLVKPFGSRELVARIRAVTRRTSDDGAVTGPRYTIGSLTVDVGAHHVELDGTTVELTRKEFELLAHLISDLTVVHRRRDILEAVWDENWYGPTKTLDVHIAALRKRLGDPGWIETVRGVGYRMHAVR